MGLKLVRIGEDKPSPLLCLRSGLPGSSIVALRWDQDVVAIASISHSSAKSEGRPWSVKQPEVDG